MSLKKYPLIAALSLCVLTVTGYANDPPSRALRAGVPNCLIHNGTIYQGIVMPGELKTVHGPYTATCETTFHEIKLRSLSGALTHMRVEKLVGNEWQPAWEGASDMLAKLGTGTFRVVIDNRLGETAIQYKGTFSVPL